MARSAIRVKDNGFKAFFKRLRAMDGADLKVGIQGSDAYRSRGTLSMADLGRVHEFGFAPRGIPSRSFLRATFDEKQRTYANRVQDIVARTVKLKSNPRGALRILGELIRGDIVRRINEQIPPPLKPKTIARKGSTTPLVDTGQLVQSITARVE